MDEKQLQALYNSLSSHLDIGDYNSFKAKMQTPDDRKNFYNAVSKEGFDIGDYDSFEKRIGGEKKNSGNNGSPLSSVGTMAGNTGSGIRSTGKTNLDNALDHAFTGDYKPEPIAENKDTITQDDIENDPVKTILYDKRKQYDAVSKDYYSAHRQLPSDNTALNTSGSQLKLKSQSEDLLQKQYQFKDAATNFSNALATVGNHVFQNGKVAGDYLNSVAQKNGGKLPDNNETVQLAIQKNNQYNQVVNDIQNYGSITMAALANAKKDNPLLAKQLQAAGQMPDALEGRYVAQYLNEHNNDIEAYVNNNPKDQNDKDDYESLKSGLLTRFPEFGANVVANEVSRARQQAGMNSMILNTDSKSFEDETDRLAERMYKNDPVKKQIYDSVIKGDKSKYIDTPSFLNSFGQSFGRSVEGSINSVRDFLGDNNTSNDIYGELNKQANSVSADAKGIHGALATAGDFAGVIAFMATAGSVFKGAGVNPLIADKIVTGLTFGDQMLKEGEMKHPDEKWKAYLSGITNTAAFMMLSNIFPSGKVAQVFEKAKPGFENAIKDLSEESITNGVAKNKLNDVITNVIGQYGKGISEMGGLTLFNQALDKGLGMDEKSYAQFHPESELADVVKSMAIGNLLPSIIVGAKEGVRNTVKDNIWEMASNPKRAESILSALAIDHPEQSDEIKQRLDNLNFIAKVKADLDTNTELNDSQKKNYLLQSVNEKLLQDKVSNITDPKLKEQPVEQIQQSQKIKDDILSGKDNGTDILPQEKKVSVIMPEDNPKPNVINQSSVKERKSLIDEATKSADDITGVYKSVFLNNPEQVMKEAAEQLNSSPDEARVARATFGDKISDIALKLFPDAKVENANPETNIENKQTDISTEEKKPVDETVNKNEQRTEDKIKVGELIDKPITYNGKKAILYQDGQAVVAKIDGENKEYELGNINEIKNHPISDYGIEHETSVVNVNDKGNIEVRGTEYQNNYSNPLAAINYDKDGNVVSVNLETDDGKKRTFRDNVAEDIAYQIHLKEINKNNATKSEFEDFINTDNPTKSEVNDARLSETTEKKPVGNNEKVQREKAESKPTTTTVNGKENESTKNDTGEGNIQQPTKGQATESNSKTTGNEGGTPPQQPNATEPAAADNEGNTVGVSHDELSKLAKRLGLPEIPRGTKLTAKEYADRGRILIENGADPLEVARQFEKDGLINADRVSIVRAHLENLTKDADVIGKEKGFNSDEYKAAKQKIDDFARDVVKPMGTEWSATGESFKGSRDIDTDSFTTVKQSVEDVTGKSATPSQEKKILELTKRNEELKKKADDLEKKLIDETNKNIGKKSGSQTFTEKAKNVADKFRKLKTKPFKFKDENGNEHDITKMGVGWNDLVELGAKAIEKTGQIADGVKAIIDKIKDTDFYVKLSDDGKKLFEQQLTEHYQREQENTPEAKNIRRLEKELSDLQDGKAKQQSPKRELSDREKELQEQIKDEKEKLGLTKSKSEKPLTEEEQKKKDADELEQLQSRFVDKKDNKFSPDEARDIWGYGKKNYLDKGVGFRDMVANVANDLGLKERQVNNAITSPKVKPISDAMWKAQSSRMKHQQATKDWVAAQNENPLIRAWQKISGTIRGEYVFGHGAIFVGTHAAGTIFQPKLWKYIFPAYMRGWKYAYGNEANYEREMAEFKNRPLYLKFQKEGLQNDVDNYNAEELQRSQKFLGKLAGAGQRGFNAIKVLRQDWAESEYNKLSTLEKNDPASLEHIVRLVNNGTGATNVKVNPVAREIMFAPGMEMARWARLIRNPAQASYYSIKWLYNATTGKGEMTPGQKVFVKTWAKRTGWAIGTYTGALLANAAIQNTLNPKNPVNLTDPNKPDFLAFKFGDLTIDPTGGLKGVFNLVRGMVHIAGESKKELKGDTPFKAEVKRTGDYLRGKLAPAYSIGADFLAGEDFNREVMPTSNETPTANHHKMSWLEYSAKHLPLPLAETATGIYNNALDNVGKDNRSTLDKVFTAILAGTISGGTGLRTSEYNTERDQKPTPFNDEDKKDPIFKYFLDKGMELPNTSLSSEKITDNENSTQKKISEYPKEIQDKYSNTHKEILKEELQKTLDKGVYVKTYKDANGKSISEVSLNRPKGDYEEKDVSNLSKDELTQVLHLTQSQATTKAKKEVFSH